MTLSIERARSRKPITLLTILGVLLLPAVIGGILVAALQNPTERLDTMTAAIVNNDEPVTIDDQYTPLGRQLAAGLVEGSDDMDSNLTWVISNEEDAADGLADGTYQAVVTIPEEFSAAATSAGQRISTGSGSAEQATIQVTTPDDGLVADDLITSQIATVAASSMGTMLSEATTENILVGFTTIGDQIGEAANGADELANGSRSAADGAAELPGGAAQLADGAAQLGSGASGLANGLGTIASGTRDAASGANQLGSGLDTISSNTRDAADGANQLGQGLLTGADALEAKGIVPSELVTGAQQLATGTGALSAQCRLVSASAEFCDQLDALATGAGETAAGLDQVAAQAPAIVAAQLREAGTAATTLGGGLDQLAAGVDQSAGGARGLATGLSQLASGVDQSAAGAAQLSTGAAGLSDGATQLADGAGELATGLDDLAGGNEELASGLHQAADQLPSFSDQESTSLASVIADPVTSNAQANTIFGPTAIPLLAAVVLWFGGLASFIVMRAHTARTLTSRRSSAWLTLGGFWPAAAIGAGQGVLVALIVQIVASYDAATWWAFAGTAVLAGIAFAAVNQALVAVFGGAGRWVSALVGVVAIATGLISTVPDWLSSIGAMLPTAPAFTGLIAGSSSAVAGLIAWAVLSLIVTTVAVALRRTTSAKAVLATA